MIAAIYRDIVTKRDLDKLEERILAKFDALEMRISNLEKGVDGLERRNGNLEKRVYSLESRIDGLEKRFGSLEGRIHRIEARLDSLFRWVVGLILGMWISIILTLIPILLKLLGAI